jgi:hypothetical protein
MLALCALCAILQLLFSKEGHTMNEEYNELLLKLINVQDALATALLEITAKTQACAVQEEDIGEISDSAYSDVVAMLKQLNRDYCVKTLAEDATA